MLGIQSVVVLRDCSVLQLCCICEEVRAFVLPSQVSAAALKSVHGEMAGNVDAFGSFVAAECKAKSQV